MRRIDALILVALATTCGRCQEFHIQLDGAALGGTDMPIVLTMANAWEASLPIETEYAIQTPSIQNALELTSEQLERIKKEIVELQTEFQPKYERAAARTEDNDEKMKRMEEIRAQHQQAIQVVVDEILLPHQTHRLKQLQNRGRVQTSFNSSQYSELEALLKLTADQQQKLVEKSAEMRKKLAAEIQALKQKRSQEVLESVLTDTQREKLRELLGDPLTPVDKH